VKISIFFRTFFILLFSFSILFLGSTYYLYKEFSAKYVEENIIAVKEAIQESASQLQSDTPLSSTILEEASSETQYIRFTDNVVTEMIGPIILNESEIIGFVIDIYDSEEVITDGNLSYTITKEDDINTISYIYKIGTSDYLLVLTKVQSLNNIEMVLNDITITQGTFLFVTILVLSLLISSGITRPIKKLNRYAKSIARLDFSTNVRINRKDELQELTTSLNEMAFNLQKTYVELENANAQLKGDIEFEKQQEEKKKNLIMTINHELKTPLSVCKGMIEGMIDGVGRYQKKERYLPEVLKQIDKIESIAKDLTYSLKLEDIAKANDQCELTILKTALDSVKEFAKQKKIKLSIKLVEGTVFIHPELLQILTTNLLKNAILYSKSNQVSLETYQEKNTVCMEIRNTGEISEKELEKIFEPYYRIQVETEGSGLGLFIVKQICELYQMNYKIFNDNGTVVSKIFLKSKSMS